MRSAKIVVPNTFAGLGHSAPGGLGHDDVFFDLWIKGLGHFTGRAGHREGERLAPGPNQFSKLRWASATCARLSTSQVRTRSPERSAMRIMWLDMLGLRWNRLSLTMVFFPFLFSGHPTRE